MFTSQFRLTSVLIDLSASLGVVTSAAAKSMAPGTEVVCASTKRGRAGRYWYLPGSTDRRRDAFDSAPNSRQSEAKLDPRLDHLRFGATGGQAAPKGRIVPSASACLYALGEKYSRATPQISLDNRTIEGAPRCER